MRLILSKTTVLVLVASFLSLGGCSSDETNQSSTTDNAPVITPATQNDIPTAVSDAGLDTLTRLLRETGLVDTLRGEGPYTLFAPSDLAFTELPGGSPNGMSPAELQRVLRYHIIPGRFETASLAGAMDINTLEGGTMTFSVVDGSATVTDASFNIATVTSPDMNVDNGVIHVIDGVLTPGQ